MLTGFSLIMTPSDFRNIAIIAHVDHGKTTLVDKLLQGGGAYRENQVVEDRVMDSMDLEREKGITIKAKNTAVHWGEKTINIVDTPGHADFGGEVERVLKMVDGVLLLVDAYEGPMAQTRFVLRKAIQHGLKVVVVINKIDRENADPIKAHDEVLELLLELDATDEQFNAPFLYASARDGYAIVELEDPREDLTPLFQAILDHIPPPEADPEGSFQMLVSNIDWNDYVGRIAVGKILRGHVEGGKTIYTVRTDGTRIRGKVTKLFEYSGLASHESKSGIAGNIVGISGFEEIDIGDTLTADEEGAGLPFVEIDPPTIEMEFAVNDGPLAGREGKYVTSRQLRDRLYREVRTNVSIKVSDMGTGRFALRARGAMQIAVLVEQMRREGFEVLVSRPTAITRQIDGRLCEPFETLWVESPDECLGGIMQNLANRKARITAMDKHPHGTTVEAVIPTRGLIGFELDLVNMTGGRGVMSHLFHDYAPHCGSIATRLTGTLVSMENGTTKAYGLDALESRGILFVGAGEEVYEGMIVGENPRTEDMPVNPTKAKQLTNFRSQGDGKGIQLSPHKKFTLERAIEYIAPDEYVEATPESIRLRKRILNATIRKRAAQTA